MAILFPTSAYTGQQFQQGSITWTYNGTSWQASSYSANVATTTLISDAAPVSPTVGNLWWQSNIGALRIYYTDSSGGHWIDANPSGTGYYVVPGGTNGSIQYNSGGSFTGANLAFDNTTGNLVITSVSSSVSATTGALIVAGGAAVGGNLWVSGNLNIQGTTNTINNTVIENTEYVNNIYGTGLFAATVGNIGANHVGTGTYLTNLTGAQVTGTVPSATYVTGLTAANVQSVIGSVSAGSFPTLNQNTSGTAANATNAVVAQVVTGLTASNVQGVIGSVSTSSFPTLNQNTTGTATTATTANGLNTTNNYQVNSLGVGTAASGTAGEIRATNNVTAYYNTSDIRVKENIVPLVDALLKLEQVGAYSFNYKTRPDQRMVGVIAQELMAVYPELVYETTPLDSGTGLAKIYAVNYELLSAVLLQSVKELYSEVNLIKKHLGL